MRLNEESELNVELIGTISPTNPGARFANIKADGSIEMVTVGSDILDGKATVIDIQSRIMYLKEGSKLTHVSRCGLSLHQRSHRNPKGKSGRARRAVRISSSRIRQEVPK